MKGGKRERNSRNVQVLHVGQGQASLYLSAPSGPNESRSAVPFSEASVRWVSA